MKLPKSFYTQNNVVEIARQLLGKYLFTDFEGELCAGMIVETEAYSGAFDKACHAHFKKRTQRTEIMYQEGGIAYIYLCYGIHSLFNVVTNELDTADAVLIRALEPKIGIETMLKRRKLTKKQYRLTAGPGIMSQAMGITTQYNGIDLIGNQIWLEDQGIYPTRKNILASPRIGIDYAEEDALLPWRFTLAGNPWCSKSK
ncbi:MAG: DNA-3-methyladenine glycosylase [Microscillaceae bacterium]|nr:DNA-3-methyladenine glycosylase [Microscillaceae bacterium]